MRKFQNHSALPERKGTFEKSSDGINYRLTFRESKSGRRIAFQIQRETTSGLKWCTLSSYYKNLHEKALQLFQDELFFIQME